MAGRRAGSRAEAAQNSKPPRPPVTGAVGIEDAVDQADQPRPGVRPAVAGGSPPLGRPFALEGKGLGEEPLAGSEVVLDRADGEARLGGDVGKPRRFDASLADHPRRRMENLRLALGSRDSVAGSRDEPSLAFVCRTTNNMVFATSNQYDRYGIRNSRRAHRPRLGHEAVR